MYVNALMTIPDYPLPDLNGGLVVVLEGFLVVLVGALGYRARQVAVTLGLSTEILPHLNLNT